MLEIEGLSSYYGGAHILQGIDLTVGASETVVVLGRNGVGKTTLIRSIMGLTPPSTASGTVRWKGEQLLGSPSNRVARSGIGLVPQGRHVFGSLTVDENLRVVSHHSDKSMEAWTEERVYDFFPRLAERSSQRARTLSGGEQQMLAIGRALMINPTLLLMDEPSEGLAPKILDIIGERMTQLKTSGVSILLVEQNLKMALRLADRVYILGPPGVVVWSGLPADLEADAEAQTEFLGVS